MIKSFINKCFSLLEFYRYKRRLNILKTIYVNLRCFSLPVALRFPIFIYGKCKVISLKGEIKIAGEIKKGTIKIGVSDPLRSLNSISTIKIAGKIIFGNNVVLRRGITLGCEFNSVINIGRHTYIGDNVTILSHLNITFGNYVRVANNTTFMDSDIHFMLNVDTNEIKYNRQSILIGNNNWIGSWVTVKKGAITPDFTIVVGPYSMLSKDYRSILPPYSIIGGVPAKLITSGLRRIDNNSSELLLNNYYATSNKTFVLDKLEIESFCLPD